MHKGHCSCSAGYCLLGPAKSRKVMTMQLLEELSNYERTQSVHVDEELGQNLYLLPIGYVSIGVYWRLLRMWDKYQGLTS